MCVVYFFQLFRLQQYLQVDFKSIYKVKNKQEWAIQAQDYAMAKWAIGLRLPAPDSQAVLGIFRG